MRTRSWICTRRCRECFSYSCPVMRCDGRVETDGGHRQLMVRDGLLSPNSKLVASSRGTTPLPDGRPGSVFSVVSAGAPLRPFSPLVHSR